MSEREKEDRINNPSEEDWFLQTIVKMVNIDSSAEFGITLNVGGFLVSGILVGGKQYFEGLAEYISSGVDEKEAAEGIKKTLGKPKEIYGHETSKNSLPSYIHLKEAKFYNTQGNPPIPGNQGVWWRGRISEVQGFMFGKLGAEEK